MLVNRRILISIIAAQAILLFALMQRQGVTNEAQDVETRVGRPDAWTVAAFRQAEREASTRPAPAPATQQSD